MHRWLAVFLICLLPLQASWAAVANYCGHGHEAVLKHFGHHDEEHLVSAEAADHDDHSGGLEHGHHHDHLSGFLGLTSDSITIPFPTWPSVLPGDDLTYPSLPPDQPERPNWHLPA